MNYVVSLLLRADTEPVALALQQLNVLGGRPLFEDEINPEWAEVYSAIKWMELPDEVERHGLYLHMKWREVERSAKAYILWLEKAGAGVLFDYASGETASDDEGLLEDDDDEDFGVYHLKVNGQMKRLTRSNLKTLLPDCPFEWSEDPGMNVRNIMNHIRLSDTA